MNKKNSRIIILTYFQFLTIFDGIENSSCSENGETKDTTCMDRCTITRACILPLQPSFPDNVLV